MISETSKNWKKLRPFIRGTPVIFASVLICLWAANWYIHHTVPMYESTVKIRLADPKYGEAVNPYNELNPFNTANKIGTEVEMLKSKLLLQRTLDSIDMQTTIYRVSTFRKSELYADAPFKASIKLTNKELFGAPIEITILPSEEIIAFLPGSPAVHGRLGLPVQAPGADILLVKNAELLKLNPALFLPGDYEIVINTPEKTIEDLTDKLDITSVDKDFPILRLIFKSPIPQKAADYVNILANTYVEDFSESKLSAANLTVQFLDNQLAEIGSKLTKSEDTLESFRMEKGVINIHQETETDLRKISQLKIELANLAMNLAAIDSLNQYVQRGKKNFFELAPNFEAFNDLLSTEMVKRINTLRSDRRDLMLQYTENDDKVKSIDKKITDLTTYLPEAINNTRKNYEVKYLQIKNAIGEAENVFVGLPTKEKDMAILERNFILNEKLYNYLHQKKTEAEIARAAPLNSHRIIANGEVPTRPVSPNKVIILAVSAFLGLVISLALIYLSRTLLAKVNDSETIEKNSETPVVAEVLDQRNEQERRIHFNDIAIQLGLRKLICYPVVLTYSSFDDKEGKSYNAVNFAKSLAAGGRKTLIVDVNGNTAEKHAWPMLPADSPDIFLTPFPGLHYHRAGTRPGDTPLNPELVKEQLAVWKLQYDAIIVRNEALIHSSAGLAYMASSDTNLFILDAVRTPLKRIQEADLLKLNFHIPSLYFVLNRTMKGYSLGTGVKQAILWKNKKPAPVA